MLVPQEQTGGKQGPEWKEWVREPGLTPAEKLGPRNGRRHVVGGGGGELRKAREKPGGVGVAGTGTPGALRPPNEGGRASRPGRGPRELKVSNGRCAAVLERDRDMAYVIIMPMVTRR